MKRNLLILTLVLLVAAGLLVVFTNPGGLSVAGFDLGGGERAWLRDRSEDFIEDLKFKDFTKASKYHLPATQEARDIPELIRRVFGIKHEVLDIVQYHILDVDLDRSTSRSRVRVSVDFRVMGPREVRDSKESMRNIEMFLYWFRGADGKWTMELESSLR